MFLEKKISLEKSPKVTQFLQQYFFATFRQNSYFLKKMKSIFVPVMGANTFFGVWGVWVGVLMHKERPTKNLGRLIKF